MKFWLRKVVSLNYQDSSLCLLTYPTMAQIKFPQNGDNRRFLFFKISTFNIVYTICEEYIFDYHISFKLSTFHNSLTDIQSRRSANGPPCPSSETWKMIKSIIFVESKTFWAKWPKTLVFYFTFKIKQCKIPLWFSTQLWTLLNVWRPLYHLFLLLRITCDISSFATQNSKQTL